MPEMVTDRSNYQFSIAGQSVYPHIKLTREPFPRMLVTRRIEQDNAEYFGAFLNKTNVRILIDLLNRTFRLRSCFIDIDGGFPVPCVQYYRRRCVAPCVESLCGPAAYARIVELVRIFLVNDRDLLREELGRRIFESAGAEDYETAAFLRDIRQAAEAFWANPRYQIWLDDAVDTFELGETGRSIEVFLVTSRARRTLGRKVFSFERVEGVDPASAIGDVISQFYHYHLPREIRVYRDFARRRDIARELSARFGKKVRISLVSEETRRMTADRALRQTRSNFDIEMARGISSADALAEELAETFGLAGPPRRIEAFDVAHLSGTRSVAAKAIWNDGRFLKNENEFWFSDLSSEPEALEEFIRRQFDGSRKTPDLLLIDGGKGQLNAAMRGLGDLAGARPAVIAAVKPPRQHSQISHFITDSGSIIPFSADSDAQSLLQVLRDEAHELANYVHRARREMAYYYEPASILPSINEAGRQKLLSRSGSVQRLLNLRESDLAGLFDPPTTEAVLADIEGYNRDGAGAVEPLVVPIRFDAQNGDAEDLRPIET
jgi:excinuclease ABC subunit C